MAAMPSTVSVTCPRCEIPIVCTLTTWPASRPKPGKTAELVASVPDLADKFAAHYAAEHADVAYPKVYLDVPVSPRDFGVIDSDEFRARIGLPPRSAVEAAQATE